MAVAKPDTHHYTYADYLKGPEGPSDELIDGVFYVREPPPPSVYHQGIVVGLCQQIENALGDKPCRVFVAPFGVRLPKSDEADDRIDTVLEPDVLIISDLQKLDARGMRGAPDWVAEVLSPSTASYDQTVKVPVYERAGVLEVWLIHPIDRVLTVYRLESGRYGQPTVLELKGRTPLAAVPGVTIDWDRVLARML